MGSILCAHASATITKGSFDRLELATEPTYILGEHDRGKFVRVEASASDSIGFNSSYKSSGSFGPVR